MSDQIENSVEKKIEQQNTQPIAQNIKHEASPDIKSEENQANWKAFRQQREDERKARESAEKMAREKHAEAEAMRAALEAITNRPSRQEYQEREQVEEDESARIDRRVKEIIEEREKVYFKEQQEKELREYPEKLNAVHTDFKRVCTEENLDYLEYHYPEVAQPYKHMPDGFQKWSLIYKAVKKFVPNADSAKDTAKMDRNLAKPGSISSAGATQGPGSLPAARLDDSRKASNWERMQRTLKGLSN
jgi:hypothetical protein